MEKYFKVRSKQILQIIQNIKFDEKIHNGEPFGFIRLLTHLNQSLFQHQDS